MRRQLPNGVKQWYIYCQTADTNQQISRILDDRMRCERLCKDGKIRKMWLVSEEELKLILSSAASSHFRPRAFFSQSNGGPILEHHWNKPNVSVINEVRKMILKHHHARSAT